MLLEYKDLKTYFIKDKREIKSVDGLSFTLDAGETVAIVGESGSGKSVTALSTMGLLNQKNVFQSGEILFEGKNLLKLSKTDIRKLRGKDIAMIFQEPMTSLNPALKIGYQMSEVYMTHFKMDKKLARKKSLEMLEKVEINDPDRVYKSYSHEISGGMRQRVMIAMALSLKPKILIADEPTTALDVTVQSEIFKLIKNLKKEYNTGIIFITHDLHAVEEMADYVNVMYSGQIVERAKVDEIFKNPLHPYTKGLLNARPIIGKEGRLEEIKGQVPNPTELKENCHFCDRCKHMIDVCKNTMPPENEKDKHYVRCFLYSKEAGFEKNS